MPMKKLNTGTWKQKTFYGFIFIAGYFYQPNFIYENFWSRADFYKYIPFTVPFWFYSIVCGFGFTVIVWSFVKFSRKHL